MKTNEMLEAIGKKEFLDKLYGFAYQRCSSSFEAEDLCSDIIISLLAAVKKQDNVENFYAFVWTVARRVYADFCEKRSKQAKTVSIENAELDFASVRNEIDDLLDSDETMRRLKLIYREIAFLSKEYREVMVMFYLDEMKIKDISVKLGITENTVKQRLFSARNTIRKEVSNMENKNLSLKPVRFYYMGTGNPVGNQPSLVTQRTFSQSLVYLLKDKAKTAQELSEELCVPMLFIEEELEIQCHGTNGEYGMVRRLENGKYIANVIVADYSEAVESQKIFGRHLPKVAEVVKEIISKNKEKILSFPYLSKQTDTGFILWSLVNRSSWQLLTRVQQLLAKKYFADITPASRPYTQAAIASPAENNSVISSYGCDGIDAYEICGYKRVFISNMYGPRLEAHFHCGHNIGTDPLLLLLIRSIGGLKTDSLTESEKETAAKAIECGYIRKNGDQLEPNVLVFELRHDRAFNSLLQICDKLDNVAEDIACELAEFIKSHLPKHLENEFLTYSSLIASACLGSDIIEECIKANILSEPESLLCGEGVIVVVEK